MGISQDAFLGVCAAHTGVFVVLKGSGYPLGVKSILGAFSL